MHAAARLHGKKMVVRKLKCEFEDACDAVSYMYNLRFIPTDPFFADILYIRSHTMLHLKFNHDC